MEKRLYRVREGRIIWGVAGGLADYFSMDPILVRVIFVILTFANGLGILGYLILLIVMPEQPAGQEIKQGENMNNEPQMNPSTGEDKGEKWRRRGVLPGVILIALGLIFLISNYLPQYDMGKLWPIFLIIIGAALLWPRKR